MLIPLTDDYIGEAVMSVGCFETLKPISLERQQDLVSHPSACMHQFHCASLCFRFRASGGLGFWFRVRVSVRKCGVGVYVAGFRTHNS